MEMKMENKKMDRIQPCVVDNKVGVMEINGRRFLLNADNRKCIQKLKLKGLHQQPAMGQICLMIDNDFAI
jgi:hypothetical protein